MHIVFDSSAILFETQNDEWETFQLLFLFLNIFQLANIILIFYIFSLIRRKEFQSPLEGIN